LTPWGLNSPIAISAWKTAEGVLPSFADALSQWLGGPVWIMAVTPDETKVKGMDVKASVFPN